jgi:hypothetical protein
MPPFKQHKTRLCRCGCDHPVSLWYRPDGRFKGYGRYAQDCPNKQKRLHTKNPKKGRPGELNGRWMPDGMRRLHHSGQGLYYWKIKVNGEWQYEHRYIVSQRIGRPLTTNEHVHHDHHQSLDNDPGHLVVLTPGAHANHHFGPYRMAPNGRWSKEWDACRDCGTTDRKHESHGRCRICRGAYEQSLKLKPQKLWAKLFRVCVDCGTTAHRHAAHGKCVSCYERAVRLNHPKEQHAYDRAAYQRNIEKRRQQGRQYYYRRGKFLRQQKR